MAIKKASIDMWEEDSRPGGYHVFGYWAAGQTPHLSNPPGKKIRIPILGNGNYPGNPTSRQFFKWLAKGVKHPELFTWEEYKERFLG